jgi:hypothetical protein
VLTLNPSSITLEGADPVEITAMITVPEYCVTGAGVNLNIAYGTDCSANLECKNGDSATETTIVAETGDLEIKFFIGPKPGVTDGTVTFTVI